MQKIKCKLNTVNTQKVYPQILAPTWNALSLKLNIKTAPTIKYYQNSKIFWAEAQNYL